MIVIALVGLSGVGKSTFLKRLQEQHCFIRLGASDLIKSELRYRTSATPTSEELRLGAVLDNQELLVAGFLREAANASLPIIFDGHILIDGQDGLVEIPENIFGRIGLTYIVVLQDDPSKIVSRRKQDIDRLRPMRTQDELRVQQDLTVVRAATISRALGIEMLVINPHNDRLFERLLDPN